MIKNIHIIHTNDLHSHFTKMPKIAGGIKEIRERCRKLGDEVIVVDLGDHMDRMSPITEGTWGKANIAVMNESGYDYVTVGNNEGLTFPREVLDRLYHDAHFKVLCSNLEDINTKQLLPDFLPYIIHEADGVKIGLFGVTAPFQSFYELLDLKASSTITVIKKLVEHLKKECDIMVLLSHVGLPHDIKVAEEFPEIHVIIGAHTHHFLEKGKKVRNTYIFQAGKFGNYLGHIVLKFNTKTKELQEVQGKCIEVNHFAGEKGIEEVIESESIKAEREMQQVVVTLENDFPLSWEEESPLGNLLAEGLRHWVKADIGLVNSGTLLFPLGKGAVTKGDLLRLCPHPINPCKIRLLGKHVRSILSDSIKQENVFKEIMGFGFRGKIHGWMSVDGMKIYYDRTENRIVSIEIEGEELEDEKWYDVGTIDMYTFSPQFPGFQQGSKPIYYLPEFLRDILAHELMDQNARQRAERRRWIQV